MDDVVDFLFLGFVWVIGLFCVGMLLFIPYALYSDYQWKQTHTCVASHVEHREAWTQIIWTGKTAIPIFHPERDETVCDKWVEKDRGVLLAP